MSKTISEFERNVELEKSILNHLRNLNVFDPQVDSIGLAIGFIDLKEKLYGELEARQGIPSNNGVDFVAPRYRRALENAKRGDLGGVVNILMGEAQSYEAMAILSVDHLHHSDALYLLAEAVESRRSH